MKKRVCSLVAILLFALVSCESGPTTSGEGGQASGGGAGSGGEKAGCSCSSSDVRGAANQVVRSFTQIQNDLPSDMARIMRIDGVDARDNCTWVVTFKISWPFGNTDGAHPDEYIKKRYACDGKQAYEQ